MRSGSRTTSPVLFAAQHALFWLMAGCFIGLWLAVLLLCPGLNAIFGEFTYGRIVPIHLNFQLYGWTSLPLVAWLFYLFSSKSPSNGSPERGAVVYSRRAAGFVDQPAQDFSFVGHSGSGRRRPRNVRVARRTVELHHRDRLWKRRAGVSRV